MVSIPSTQGTLLEDYIYKEWQKVQKCTILTGVKEVCNWKTLQLKMFVRMI